MFWRIPMTLMLASTLLIGCASASDGSCSLIPLRDYDAATRDRLALEVMDAAPSAIWPAVVADYATLRDAIRACKGS